MVCVLCWLSGYSMTCLLILSYYSITDLAKHGDPVPIGLYKGWPVLLHPRQSPVHHLLFLQSSECPLPPSTYCTVPLWGLVSSWHWGIILTNLKSLQGIDKTYYCLFLFIKFGRQGNLHFWCIYYYKAVLESCHELPLCKDEVVKTGT